MNKKLLSRLLTIAFLGLFVWYGLSNRELFSELGELSIFTLLAVAGGKLLLHVVTALFTKWTAEVFTKHISIGETAYIGVYAAAGNFFGPLLGGAGVRAYYLKKYYKLPLSRFSSMMLGYYLIIFSFNFVVAILALTALDAGSQRNTLLVLFTLGLLGLGTLFFVRPPSEDNRLVAKLRRNALIRKIVDTTLGIIAGWQEILRSKQLLVKMLVLAAVNFLAIQFLAYVEFTALGVDASFAALALYAVFVNISLLLSFTPGAIGLRESLLILIGSTLMIGTEEILQAAIIDRGVNFVLLILLVALARWRPVKQRLIGDREAN